MKNGAKWLVIGLLAMGTLLGRTEESRASGFYDPKAVFTNKERPDFPLESFARGDLGLLQPTYARSYLYVAYRHLAGIGLDKEEQKAVLALWEERMNNRAYDHQNWVAEWMKARRQVAEFDPSPITDVYRPQQLLYWSANCLRDTFRSAIQTLDQRIQLFGADSDDIFEWVTGQDAVLANCSSRDFILPRPARSNHPTLRADRAYQTAAAHFYAGHFEIAEKMFQAIAGDASSPWKTIAPYLAARSLIRRATLISPEGAVDLKVLFQGEAQLEAVLSDARLKEIHPAARRLLGFVRFKLRPVQRFDELGRTLVQKNSGATLKQDLWDYTWLFDRLGARGGGDLTDWILSFQRGATDHALESWRTTQSLPWLAALLASIPGKHPYAGEALKAAAAIDPASPGYPTASYHRARILAEAGRKDEARRLLDKLLAQKGRKAPVPVSARNAFLSQRMPLARNLDEFLNDAPRRPAMISDSVDERELPAEKGPAAAAYFDGDAVEVFNQGLPLSLLKTIALKKVLPAHLRRELAVAAWVRAILLDNEKIALDLAPALQELVPDLREQTQAYVNSPNRAERKFAAAFVILKHPGMRPYLEAGLSRTTRLDWIDNYGKNWWCSFEKIHATEPPGEFPNKQQKAEAHKELVALLPFDNGSNYLSKIAIEWANGHPEDPRVPEALYRTVRSTRYGCAMDKSRNFSREAFQILHRKYPKSEWTKKTPYWY